MKNGQALKVLTALLVVIITFFLNAYLIMVGYNGSIAQMSGKHHICYKEALSLTLLLYVGGSVLGLATMGSKKS